MTSGAARRRGRRGRRAVVLLALFTVGGAGWLLVQSSALDLEAVRVRGARQTDVDEIRRVASVRTGDALLLVDRGGVAGRVERLPWVADARVSFSIPDTLVITVEERRAVGWIRRDDDRVSLVDADGRVLDQRAAAPEGLPELVVDAEVPAPGRRVTGAGAALRIAATTPEPLRPRVKAVQPASTGWVLSLDTADVVRLGPADDLARKWAALEAVVAELGERSVYLIDVRAPSVPAVRAEKPAKPAPPVTTTVSPTTTTP